jgi:predicted small metal-binding protein
VVLLFRGIAAIAFTKRHQPSLFTSVASARLKSYPAFENAGWFGSPFRMASELGFHPGREEAMGRKFIDCRQFPSEMNCTVAICADSEAELLEAAVQHAVAVHQHQDTPELRDQIRSLIKDGTPSLESPRQAA